MKPVIAQFIVDIEENEDTAGNPDGKSRDVNERKPFVSPQIPPCDQNVIFNHEYTPAVCSC
jgi:hypothetical protein